MNMLQTIHRCAGGMSDDALDDERKAQKLLYAAVAGMRCALQDATILSSVCDTAIMEADRAFSDFIHDHIPGERAWDEAISEARRG